MWCLSCQPSGSHRCPRPSHSCLGSYNTEPWPGSKAPWDLGLAQRCCVALDTPPVGRRPPRIKPAELEVVEELKAALVSDILSIFESRRCLRSERPPDRTGQESVQRQTQTWTGSLPFIVCFPQGKPVAPCLRLNREGQPLAPQVAVLVGLVPAWGFPGWAGPPPHTQAPVILQALIKTPLGL